MSHLLRILFPLLCLMGLLRAEDRPSWAIIDAVDRLIAPSALFLPGRDGFVKFPDGTLAHYELPSKNYLKDGKGWQVELLSRRWRKRLPQGWTAWNDARPQHGAWRIGVIRVDVLASGLKATWVENSNFTGGKAPGEAEVMQKLDTQGQRGIASLADSSHSPPVNAAQQVERAISPARGSSAATPQPSPAANGLPAGMSRAVRLAPAPSPTNSVSQPPPPPARPAYSLTPLPLPAAAPRPPASTSPASTSPASTSPASASPASTLASPPAKPFTFTLPYIIAALIALSALSAFRKKSKRPSSLRRKPRAAREKSPPPLPVAFPAPAIDPLDLIQRCENLMTPAELAFFGVLEPLIPPAYRITTKVRLADLFNAAQGPGWQSAFNKISRKHIDFVVTDSATSRILCGIELDDSSHARPDRIERDRFVNEIFARNQLPLLRIPFSWTYYPQGLREKLIHAGLVIPAA